MIPRGGTRPTLTDANLVRGLLDPTSFADGQFTLSVDAAREAIETHVATPLGVSVEEAAALIALVTEQDMVAAIEDLAMRRGFDPREFAMVAGGGAGGLHAAQLARDLGMSQIVVPRAASVLCAYGTATGDISFDFSRSFHTTSASFDFSGVAATLAKLREDGEAFLARMSVPSESREIRMSVEARYQGQVSQLSIDLPEEGLEDSAALAGLIELFHQHHEAVYSVRADEDLVEFLIWSVDARGRTSKKNTVVTQPDLYPVQPDGRRNARIGGSHMDLPVYLTSSLAPGAEFAGPALVVDRLTTVLVPEAMQARVAADMSLVINA